MESNWLNTDGRKRHGQDSARDSYRTDKSETKGAAGILDNFGQQSSLHGIRYVTSREHGTCKRITYGLIVLGGLAGLAVLLISLVVKASQFGTVIKSELLSPSAVPFPSVKVCNLSPYYVKNQDDPLVKLLEQFESFSPEEAIDGANVTDEFLNSTSEELFHRYTFKLEDLVVKSYFDGVEINQSYWEKGLVAYQFGQQQCYIFNGPNYTSSNGPKVSHWDGSNSGLSLILNIQQDHYPSTTSLIAGAKIFVTHYKESPRFGQAGINIAPGTSAQLALSPIRYSFLPPPYTSYGNEGCVQDERELLSKMWKGNVYDRNACLYQCVRYKASLECQCYSVEIGKIEGLRECVMKDFLFGCYAQRTYQLTKDLLEKKNECDCPRRCSFVDYEMRLSSAMFPSKSSSQVVMKALNETSIERVRENYLHLQVYFESKLERHLKHEAEFTIEYFLSQLGGEMGLALGASLITVIEVIEAIFCIVYTTMKDTLVHILA